ncbi:MAG TPA: SRPBCC family protein, partial [Thermoplasmata archaeon]
NQARQWMPEIQKVDRVSTGTMGVGTEWHEVRDVDGRMMASKIRVTQFDAPTAFQMEVISKGITGSIGFTLTPQGDATVVRYQGEMKGHGLMSLFNGRINRMMNEGAGPLLDGLKRHVEARP